MDVVVTGSPEEIQRKIRILKSLVKADKAKRDIKSLKYHMQSLKAHEAALINKGA